jgi:glycosyltransferase involved in cell wall biosynthesis
MKLAIISHTEHYKDENGRIVGWGPTISEINQLAKHFEVIYHLAFFYNESPKKSSLPYTSDNIIFVSLPVSGGKTIYEKLGILRKMPLLLSKVNYFLKKVDVYQFRAPVGFGVYLIPYLTLFTNKQGWFKYAGNWNQKKPPIGYALQRLFLKMQKRKVTINGEWPEQPTHCYTFENPCLTNEEREFGKTLIANKDYSPPYSFCFVGRLEDEKGVRRIIDAVKKTVDRSFIKSIHLIGDGEKKNEYSKDIKENDLPIYIHGFLKRDQVFEIYKKSHFLLLPSTASEGFPKVIAEGMNYGCIPIVSAVSSIGQYVNEDNGFIVEPTNYEKLAQILEDLKGMKEEELKSKADFSYHVAKNFTFEHYIKRIKEDILINY